MFDVGLFQHEKPKTFKLPIFSVPQNRSYFFYPNIWSISYQTNLQNTASWKCFEIILQVGFSSHCGKTKPTTNDYSRAVHTISLEMIEF